jgi:hypothetical protein
MGEAGFQVRRGRRVRTNVSHRHVLRESDKGDG